MDPCTETRSHCARSVLVTRVLREVNPKVSSALIAVDYPKVGVIHLTQPGSVVVLKPLVSRKYFPLVPEALENHLTQPLGRCQDRW